MMWSHLLRPAVRFFVIGVTFCALVSVSFAGTLSGTVTNGTTGKPAAGVDVILLQLQGAMQPVATTKTDAQGHYQLSSNLLDAGPMLLRAVYRGVNYHEPLTPGKTSADVSVFEPTDKSSAFAITAHAIILQPNGAGLTIGEEFNIANNTQPPVAYYKSGGSFLFNVPDGAEISNVSAAGASGMGVVQTTIDKGKGLKAIDFPFRPGTSLVRITYQLPYPGNKATVHTSSPYAATNVAFFAPPPVQLSADGFAPAGQTQGFNAYMRSAVPANTELVASVSGTAPPPADSQSAPDASPSADNSQNPSVNSRVDTPGAATAASVTTMPARLDSLKWIIVGGFAALFALGAVFVIKRPEMALAGANIPADIPTKADRAAAKQPAPRASKPASTVADLDTEVHNSLDQLKDALFRLELRHQAGTISEENYARERQQIDQRLRELVQG